MSSNENAPNENPAIIIYKIAAGQTKAGATDWQQYRRPDTVTVYVDTSAAGFTRNVIYTTSLGGTRDQWLTTGADCVYEVSNKGFRVYLKNPTPMTPDVANQYQWHINWVGVEVD